MGNVSLPIGATNSGTNDWSDVHGEDQAIVDVLNGSVDATNLASNAVTTAKITDQHVTTAKIADSAVTTAKIADGTISNGDIQNAAIQDGKLTSPNNSVYKVLAHSHGNFDSVASSATPRAPALGGATCPLSGSTFTGGGWQGTWRFVGSNYSVGSLTTRFRVGMEVFIGNTTPGTCVVTAGLYPVTISGGAFTMGTVVSGSTAASSGLSTNGVFSFNSGDFAASALTDPNPYILGFTVTTAAAPISIFLKLYLEARNT